MVVKHIVKLYISNYPYPTAKKNTIQMDDFSKSVIFAKDHNIYNNLLFVENSHFVAGLEFDRFLQY